MASQAWQALQELVSRSNRPVVYAPPEMIPKWQPQYAAELRAATEAALAAGVTAEKVYSLLDRIASVDLEGLPASYLALCVEAGLSADTDLGGESLLHFLLNDPYPIPLGELNTTTSTSSTGKSSDGVNQSAAQQVDRLQQRLQPLQAQIPVQHNPACGSVTLAELLRRGAKPNLPDGSGNTALHMVVACMVSKKHFPDPTVADQQQPEQMTEESDAQQNGSSAAAATADKKDGKLEDNDAARAAYAAAAFSALLQAGWHPSLRNSNGYSVSDLILEGLSRYQTDLSDLQDPDGVAQTTVALLSQKAPDKGLQQFLDAKITGVQAVVDALLLMHHLASVAEGPRKARSAVSLVVVWLLLLLGCVWWFYRRHSQ